MPFLREISPEGVCASVKEDYIRQTAKMYEMWEADKDEYKEYCSSCAKRTSHIQGRSLWLHKEPVSTAIYKFKYNNKRGWGELFAAEMAHAYKDQVIKWGIEEIIPIPLHKSRKEKGIIRRRL